MQFKDIDSVTDLQNFACCSPSALSEITQGVNNKKLRFSVVCIYVTSLKMKRMSLSKSVEQPYSQFRKIYVLIFPWFNFK